MAGILSVWVDGTPQPQGNKTGIAERSTFVGQRPRVRMIEGRRPPARKQFKLWRERVFASIARAMPREWSQPAHAEVTLSFYFTRPPSHLKKNGGLRAGKPDRHRSRPDLDKLVRAVLDSMTEAGAIADDSTVMALHATKDYGAQAGVAITLTEAS